MTFDELCVSRYEMQLDGTDIVALYVALLRDEDRLDAFQRAALDRLRGVLYENLSVEDMEGINASYVSLKSSI